MNPIFLAQVINGKIKNIDKDKFDSYLLTLPQYVEVIVRARSKSRSNQQNRFFHGPVLDILCEETGHSKQVMKDILKGMFLSQEIIIKSGDKERKVTYVRDTSGLNTKEFNKFIKDIQDWASDFFNGMVIPDPDQVEY